MQARVLLFAAPRSRSRANPDPTDPRDRHRRCGRCQRRPVDLECLLAGTVRYCRYCLPRLDDGSLDLAPPTRARPLAWRRPSRALRAWLACVSAVVRVWWV
jgi:hypothetical protein